ncbi:hypothetical protein [uncultured Cohaesibacter sp.]|uniref:hypothetical protein n=1 Tax=uncultured Cohaesibacter sp. TaxID=1002546 RepID=UPI0029C62710|nr:hypothetical protein [uncultured Cohaesibacter sp.]
MLQRGEPLFQVRIIEQDEKAEQGAEQEKRHESRHLVDGGHGDGDQFVAVDAGDLFERQELLGRGQGQLEGGILLRQRIHVRMQLDLGLGQLHGEMLGLGAQLGTTTDRMMETTATKTR